MIFWQVRVQHMFWDTMNVCFMNWSLLDLHWNHISHQFGLPWLINSENVTSVTNWTIENMDNQLKVQDVIIIHGGLALTITGDRFSTSSVSSFSVRDLCLPVALWRRGSRSTLIKILAYRLCGAKPITELSPCLPIYRQFSNIRRTQFHNINVSRLVLQLSLPNPLKPGVKLRMKL